MELSELRKQFAKVERAIEVADECMYGDLLYNLMDRRSAMNMLASHLIPGSQSDAAFLHCLIEEYTEFVFDEPARESDRDDALNAISRMNQNLRTYHHGE